MALIHDFQTRGWQGDEFFISSFRHSELRRCKELDQAIQIGALFGRFKTEPVAAALKLGACAINVALELVDVELVKKAHEAGLRVYVYTVNETQDIARMLAMTADGIFTNYPDRVFPLLEKN